MLQEFGNNIWETCYLAKKILRMDEKLAISCLARRALPCGEGGGFKRSAHSAVPTLVAWMLGGLGKISPKWSPGQPQMEPELRKNRVKITKHAIWHLDCSQVGSRSDHNQGASPQIIDFWVPLGTPNRPKIDQWTYKVRQVMFFQRFF